MPQKQVTILLVEDSPDDVFFFRRAFQKANISATHDVAENGREAMRYLKNEGRFADAAIYRWPEIVFVDLKMPEVDGFELLRWVSKEFSDTPFQTIVLTSSDEPQDYQQALDLGAHGYFLKPILPEQLLHVFDRLRQVLERV